MRRREFIAGLGSAAALSSAAHAQPAQVPTVGYLHVARQETQGPFVEAFRKGLQEMGFVEGRNVRVEYRFGDDDPNRMSELAADLVSRNVAVIASTGGTRTATIVKAATSKIPVIFEIGADPVRNGLVASLSRPGGNLTGINSYVADLWPKLFDLLLKLLPNGRVFAIVFSGGTASQLEYLQMEARSAAEARGRSVVVLTAFTPREIDDVFLAALQHRSDGLIFPAAPLPYTQREKLAALAAQYGIPAIYPFRENTEFGGLMSYGINQVESWRLVGIYVGRVLKGEKPADLPVVQPTRFEFVINLKTAKALGLEFPPDLLSIADEVIE